MNRQSGGQLGNHSFALRRNNMANGHDKSLEKVAEDSTGKFAVPNIERLLDIAVPVVVVLAQKNITLRDALQLMPGTVVQFEKNIEEPIELLVNNVVVATGCTVKMGEHFGLQVHEILGPSATIRALAGKKTS